MLIKGVIFLCDFTKKIFVIIAPSLLINLNLIGTNCKVSQEQQEQEQQNHLQTPRPRRSR